LKEVSGLLDSPKSVELRRKLTLRDMNFCFKFVTLGQVLTCLFVNNKRYFPYFGNVQTLKAQAMA